MASRPPQRDAARDTRRRDDGRLSPPRTLEEALAIRAAGPVTVLAGGTDVYPAKAARAGWGDMRHADILDISARAGLRGIAEEPAAWRIGALTTWTDLIRAELPPQFDGLKLAAREVGGVQIQNRGTLAGNICTASPAGDGAPNLLALEAERRAGEPARPARRADGRVHRRLSPHRLPRR